MDLIEIVKNGLLESKKLSLVLIVAEGCYERESVMAQSIMKSY